MHSSPSGTADSVGSSKKTSANPGRRLSTPSHLSRRGEFYRRPSPPKAGIRPTWVGAPSPAPWAGRGRGWAGRGKRTWGVVGIAQTLTHRLRARTRGFLTHRRLCRQASYRHALG